MSKLSYDVQIQCMLQPEHQLRAATHSALIWQCTVRRFEGPKGNSQQRSLEPECAHDLSESHERSDDYKDLLTMPVAGVYPHNRPVQSISCLCLSLKITHKAAALMKRAWTMLVQWMSQLSRVRLLNLRYTSGHTSFDIVGERTWRTKWYPTNPSATSWRW
jgi:hypothetical protein